MSRRGVESKVYVGDLPRDATEKEIERAFTYYGPLKSVWVARNPAGFAFVEYEDERDAEDAVRGLDGTNICGGRVRVEHSTGRVRPKPWGGRGGGGGGGRDGGSRGVNPNDRCYECGEHGHYAYDCRRRGGRGGGGGGSRNSRSRSRSRSRDRGERSRRRSYSRSRSKSPRRVSRSKSR